MMVILYCIFHFANNVCTRVQIDLANQTVMVRPFCMEKEAVLYIANSISLRDRRCRSINEILRATLRIIPAALKQLIIGVI